MKYIWKCWKLQISVNAAEMICSEMNKNIFNGQVVMHRPSG